MLGPAKIIQLFWRGTRAGLMCTRWDNAAAKIQRSYKVYRWNLRANKFLQATLRIQRVWLGAIHRKWLRHCHASATSIQKLARAFQVRLVLGRIEGCSPNAEGRMEARRCQQDMNELIRKKKEMPETEYISRTGA